MSEISITRGVQIPDPVRINRYRRAPDLGPDILFFSGGSALTEVSQELKQFTYNSTHLITCSDSGGSSAKLRKAFAMPAIGDLRSRLMSLADESVMGQPDIYRLFHHRLPKAVSSSKLNKELQSMIAGKHPLIETISNPMRRLIRHQLGFFYHAMDKNFDLRGASIGNLILAGGYLNNHRQLDSIIFLFSKLVDVRGVVQPVISDNLHLAAQLKNGSYIVGQHRLTGKEVKPLEVPIKKLEFSAHPTKRVPIATEIRKTVRKLITKAELICYPPGSFYSSLIANLLPGGVALSIAENTCTKVYVPNLGQDPEQIGMSLDNTIVMLLKYLHAGASGQQNSDFKKTGFKKTGFKNTGFKNTDFLNFVLYDSKRGRYAFSLSSGLMDELGISVIDTKLISRKSAPYYDPQLLVAALLSLT